MRPILKLAKLTNSYHRGVHAMSVECSSSVVVKRLLVCIHATAYDEQGTVGGGTAAYSASESEKVE